MPASTVQSTTDGDVVVVTINRPEVRNAIDGPTARALAGSFREFDADSTLSVAVLTGAGGCFCSGADLTTFRPGHERALRLDADGDAPLGVSRLFLSKPVIAAVEGYAVAGGLEVAIWCDLRIAAEDAILGVFNRRWGIPLIDGGTIRLPRLIGHGRALDIVLTGRPVDAAEALRIGLVDRVVPAGTSLDEARALAHRIASFPQACMRSDRLSLYEQYSLSNDDAFRNETTRGIEVVQSGESEAGAAQFTGGKGRHGQ